VTWFRRGHAEPSDPARGTVRQAEPPDEDSPSELLRTVFTVNRFVNQNSGRLPGRAVVAARRLTDTVREIIDTSQVRPLDVYVVLSVKATLTDYLPTTLRSYLAVDPDVRELPARSGRTPAELLMEQLDSLQQSADAVLVAARKQDVDALVSQGNFLRTKFSGSDLDL
jgi:1,6-anhydro-N-acetylmuramate kinase